MSHYFDKEIELKSPDGKWTVIIHITSSENVDMEDDWIQNDESWDTFDGEEENEQ